MKLTKETLKRIIKEEMEAIQQEGFVASIKDTFFGRSAPNPAMKGFNQGPSSHNFELVDERELGFRKRKFLRDLEQTPLNVEMSKGSGMIDNQKIIDDIKADLAGIDANGHVHANANSLFLPGVIENPPNALDYVGDPMTGWLTLSKYLSGKINRIPAKNKDLFSVQQAYATKQLE